MASIIPSGEGKIVQRAPAMGRAYPLAANVSLTDRPPALPVRQEFAAFAQEALIQPAALSSENVSHLNAQFSWTVARMNALFSAMYTQGIVTEEDPSKIKDFLKEVDAIEKELPALPEEEQKKRVRNWSICAAA